MTKLKNKKEKKLHRQTDKLSEHQLILKTGKGEKREHSSAFPICIVYQGNSITDERPCCLEENPN